MSNILLVEPDFRSKFPPLGLLRLSTYHKSIGDIVTFIRGMNVDLRESIWHRIYVSSLYTWELPKTIKTINYYKNSVTDYKNIVVGGVGATLLSDYILDRVDCTLIKGPINHRGKLGTGFPAIHNYVPDYSIIESNSYGYKPENSYFCRTTLGCIRKCKYCAVCQLEPKYSTISKWWKQIEDANKMFGEKQNLVLMDNNVLATNSIGNIISKIRSLGFEKGAKLNNRLRRVDFNQGIDARLISTQLAKLLSTLPLSPVRLALDYDSMVSPYTKAIKRLVKVGFNKYTNYIMYNYKDTPKSLYRRMKLNIKLSNELGVSISGFPMRFVPIDDINRQYVSPEWKWRYLRGIQCVLQATHGVVSPNPDFFYTAFGRSYKAFLEILAMPDHYIMFREKYKNAEAKDWMKLFNKLTSSDRNEFLDILEKLNKKKVKTVNKTVFRKYGSLLDHYYPNGKVLRN